MRPSVVDSYDDIARRLREIRAAESRVANAEAMPVWQTVSGEGYVYKPTTDSAEWQRYQDSLMALGSWARFYI